MEELETAEVHFRSATEPFAMGWSVRLPKESGPVPYGYQLDRELDRPVPDDTRDLDRMTMAAKQVDVVCHLAAEANVNRFFESPLFSNDITAGATLVVLEAARRAGSSRVILASTEWVYGSVERRGGADDSEITEETPYAALPDHLYTSSKIASELFCTNYRRLFDRETDLVDQRQLESVLTDLRVSGARHVALVSESGTVLEALTVGEIESRLGGLGRTPDITRRILVVGGAGYLGSVLTRRLLAEGCEVRVLDNFIYGRRSLDAIAADSRLAIVEGDIRNIHTCVSALEGVHGVVLLGAIVGDPASKARPTETIETNVLAAQALASACKLQNIARFVYASTCSVYGAGTQALCEESSLNPVSLYARTKIASEQTVLEMGDDYFCPTVLRMGTLYGDSPRMRFDLVVNTMAMKSYTERRIQVFGGRQWRPLLSVQDAADAYLACLTADIKTVGNQIFNVGSNEQNYRIEEIAQIVSGALGGVLIERDEASLDARDYRVSFDKIEKVLEFRPHHSVREAARAIYAKLDRRVIAHPAQKIYYNHYFDSSEE